MLSKLLVFSALAASAVLGQSGDAPKLAFEVATIKAAPPMDQIAKQAAAGKMHVGIKIDQARADFGMVSLSDMVVYAYHVKAYQVSGPAWIKTERFDVMGKLPDGASKEDVPKMMQALLADRFKMEFHRDTKEESVYALLVAKGGPKMKESVNEAPPPADEKGQAIETGNGTVRVNNDGKGAVVRGGEMGTMKMSMTPNGTMRMEASKASMSNLIDLISRFMDQPVVDMTELKGTYQVALDLSLDDLKAMARNAGMGGMMAAGPGGPSAGGDSAKPADAASDPTGSSIFTTVQQLGLKLERRKAPVETIVIDHLEKTPTEN